MSLENYLSFLQQIITMTNPKDPASVALAKNALSAVTALAITSHKVDSLTWRIMDSAEDQFERLLRHKDDFQGVPGDYAGNSNKRHRLLNVLRPGC